MTKPDRMSLPLPIGGFVVNSFGLAFSVFEGWISRVIWDWIGTSSGRVPESE